MQPFFCFSLDCLFACIVFLQHFYSFSLCKSIAWKMHIIPNDDVDCSTKWPILMKNEKKSPVGKKMKIIKFSCTVFASCDDVKQNNKINSKQIIYNFVYTFFMSAICSRCCCHGWPQHTISMRIFISPCLSPNTWPIAHLID